MNSFLSSNSTVRKLEIYSKLELKSAAKRQTSFTLNCGDLALD